MSVDKLVFLYFLSVQLRTVLGNATANSSNTLHCRTDVLDQCPPNTSCDKGVCTCKLHYKQNVNYGSADTSMVGAAGATDYCIPDVSADGTPSGGNKTTSNSDQLYHEPPGAHHILSGILIPLAFVALLVGSALLMKRFQLLVRLRQRFFGHRTRRPAYEDVVLVGFEQAGRL